MPPEPSEYEKELEAASLDEDFMTELREWAETAVTTQREVDQILNSPTAPDLHDLPTAPVYWNYRVVKQVINPGGEDEEEIFTIREIYYSKGDIAMMWTQDPDYPAGESLEELRADLEHMLQALDRPVLDAKDLPRGE